MNTILIILGILIVCFFIWNKCSLTCGSKEGFKQPVLSQEGDYMKQSPVDYVYKGNGMDANPHYLADPSDRLVPLEYGGVDFYKDDRKVIDGTIFDSIGPCYMEHGDGEKYLVNNSRTRADMIDSGDMDWYRTLSNVTSHHAFTVGVPPVESDFVNNDPMKNFRGIYDPVYHLDAIGN